ncbi:MAG: Pre-mRNA-splicing factor ATP-dependent RNA helicase PRP16 [Paramarteilia canceri]
MLGKKQRQSDDLSKDLFSAKADESLNSDTDSSHSSSGLKAGLNVFKKKSKNNANSNLKQSVLQSAAQNRGLLYETTPTQTPGINSVRKSTANLTKARSGFNFSTKKPRKYDLLIGDESILRKKKKTPKINENNSPKPEEELSETEYDAELDRQWYNMDNGFNDENISQFVYQESEHFKNKPLKDKSKNSAKFNPREKKIGERARQFRADYKKWETTRILASGVVQRGANYAEIQARLDADDNVEYTAKVHLLVHNIIPPFLDGRFIFTRQPEPVIPIRVFD